MRKKLLAAIMALIGTFIASYSYYNYQMYAMPAVVSNYQPGDILERNEQNSFKMHGIIWKIFYTDQNKGYIASEDIVDKFSCPNRRSETYIGTQYISTCMSIAQNSYASTATNDPMGEMIEHLNTAANLSDLR